MGPLICDAIRPLTDRTFFHFEAFLIRARRGRVTEGRQERRGRGDLVSESARCENCYGQASLQIGRWVMCRACAELVVRGCMVFPGCDVGRDGRMRAGDRAFYSGLAKKELDKPFKVGL